ncbi:MAG: hypothetical protein MI742_08895 [Desulfobacterales bacterium]|nr:hypothetical protein [Desulfobacterales bacterium]
MVSCVIHKADFEISVQDDVKAPVMEERLVAALKEGALPRLEKVMEEWSWKGEELLIPRLELDLGVLSASDLERLLPIHFEKAFIKALEKSIGSSSFDSPQGQTGLVPWKNVFDQLQDVVRHGRLGSDLTRLSDSWSRARLEVLRFFDRYGGEAQVPRNAARSLERPQLLESLVWLSPEHGFFMGRFVVITVANRNLLLELTPVPGSSRALELLLWEFTLAWVLGEGRARGDRKGYLRHVVFAMASRQNLDKVSLISALASIFKQTRESAALEVTGLLAQLLVDLKPGGDALSNEMFDTLGPEFLFLDALGRALKGGATLTDMEAVKRGIPLFSDVMGQVVSREGRRPDVRRRMVQRFSHDDLVAVTASLGPSGKAVGQFVDETLTRENHLKGQVEALSHVGPFSELLWELSLAILLYERGPRFNFKQYVKQLVSGMAARSNTTYQTLLDAFLSIYKAQSSREVYHLLLELKEEQLKETPVFETNQFLPWHPELTDVMDDFFCYNEGVIRPPKKTPEEMVRFVLSLKKRRPVEFLTWARKLQKSPHRVARLVALLPEKSLARVLRWILEALSAAPEDLVAQRVAQVLGAARSSKKGRQAKESLIFALIQGDANALVEAAGGLGVDPLQKGRSWDEEALHFWVERLKRNGSAEAAHKVHALLAQIYQEKSKEPTSIHKLLSLYERWVSGFYREFTLALLEAFLAGDSPVERISVADQTLLLRWSLVPFFKGEKVDSFQEIFHSKISSPEGARRLAAICCEEKPDRVLRLFSKEIPEPVSETLHVVMLGIETAGRSSGLWRWRELIWAWVFQQSASVNWQPDPFSFLEELFSWMARNGGDSALIELLDGVSVNLRPENRTQVSGVMEVLHTTLHRDPQEKRKGQVETEIEEILTSKEEVPDSLYMVDNAGLVLLTPYLGTLFSRLGYLEEGRFKDELQADRAALLLDFCSHKREAHHGETLALNRLLCGTLSQGRHRKRCSLTPEERSTAHGLLEAVIANWAAVKNTSVDGLREAFLAREGRLFQQEGAWHLQVEPKAYDMLLDQLPWGITPIKHPWMETVLYVTWR